MTFVSPSNKAKHSKSNQLDRVSVVVPIRNESEHIADTLRQLLDQESQGIEVEILVVDGRSTDETREIVRSIARQHPQVQLLDNPQRFSSAARNLGVSQAKGDYIVIIDGHCEIPSRTYFKDLVNAFERTGADCLGRPQPLDVTEASPLQRAIAAARNSPLGHHPASFIYSKQELKVPAISVAAAYRRSVFDRIGKFDQRFDACEDCELNHRIDQAGMSCYLIPELAVRYHPRNSFAGLFKQLMRYGRGRVRLAQKHISSLTISSILPALFILGVLLGPILCLFVPVLWYVYWSVIVIYGLAIMIGSLHAGMHSRNLRAILWLPAVFVTIHIGSGWGVLMESVSVLLPWKRRSP